MPSCPHRPRPPAALPKPCIANYNPYPICKGLTALLSPFFSKACVHSMRAFPLPHARLVHRAHYNTIQLTVHALQKGRSAMSFFLSDTLQDSQWSSNPHLPSPFPSCLSDCFSSTCRNRQRQPSLLFSFCKRERERVRRKDSTARMSNCN